MCRSPPLRPPCPGRGCGRWWRVLRWRWGGASGCWRRSAAQQAQQAVQQATARVRQRQKPWRMQAPRPGRAAAMAAAPAAAARAGAAWAAAAGRAVGTKTARSAARWGGALPVLKCTLLKGAEVTMCNIWRQVLGEAVGEPGCNESGDSRSTRCRARYLGGGHKAGVVCSADRGRTPACFSLVLLSCILLSCGLLSCACAACWPPRPPQVWVGWAGVGLAGRLALRDALRPDAAPLVASLRKQVGGHTRCVPPCQRRTTFCLVASGPAWLGMAAGGSSALLMAAAPAHLAGSILPPA